MKTLERRYIRLLRNNISELEKRPAYITVPWWQPLAIDILYSKKQAIYLYSQYLAQKTALEALAYIERSGINKKISSACIILGQCKAIRKFLGTDKTSTVYMEKMQGIQDLLTYAISQEQNTSI